MKPLNMNRETINEISNESDNNITNPNIYALRALGDSYEKTLSQYEQSLQNYYTYLNSETTATPSNVQLFTGENYYGSSVSIGLGSFSSLANLGLTNNIIGSAIVPQGFSVTLWQVGIKDFSGLCLVLPSGNYPSIGSLPISTINPNVQQNSTSFTSEIGYSFTTAAAAVVYSTYSNSSQYITLGVGENDYSLYIRNQNFQVGVNDWWNILNHPLNGSIISVATNPVNGNVFVMDTNYNVYFQDNYNDTSPTAILIGIDPYAGTLFCCIKDLAISQDCSFYLGVGAYNNIGQASIGATNSISFYTSNPNQNENVISFAFAPDNTILTIQNNEIYSKPNYTTMGTTLWNGPYSNSNIISSTNSNGIMCVRVAPDGTLYGIGAQDFTLYTKSNYQNAGESWVQVPMSNNMISIAFVSSGSSTSLYEGNSVISADNSELQELNSKLISINNKIISLMSKTFPEYKQQINERVVKNSDLEKEKYKLISEKNKVNKKINEYDSLNQEKNDTEVALTSNYYKYIIYILLTIILIVIFVLLLFRVKVFKDVGEAVATGVGDVGGQILG